MKSACQTILLVTCKFMGWPKHGKKDCDFYRPYGEKFKLCKSYDENHECTSRAARRLEKPEESD